MPDAPDPALHAPSDTPVGSGAPAQASFDKPNLQLRDPDPYAFANRIWRLTFVFTALVLLASGHYLVGMYWYQARYNAKRAEYDLAREELPKARARLEDFTLASRLVAKKVGPSVVSIYRPHFRGSDGQGSGVVMDKRGFVLTNWHVVEQAVALKVQLDDGRELDASVVGGDRFTDLAVLKINANNLIEAEWGDSESLELGDMVWALGSPFGLSRSITFGIVSAKHRSSASGIRTASVYQEYLQTDAAVNPGNSGGPLVDIEGRVVGINTAILGATYQGVSFAIPSEIARDRYEQLRDQGFIQRGYLGVDPRTVPERMRRKMNLAKGEGVLVYEVVQDGPASLAGIQRGDVILRWNDYKASDPSALSRTIADTEIGSTAVVLVKRIEGAGQASEKRLNIEVGLSPYSSQAHD